MSAKLLEYREAVERQLNDKSKPWTRYFEKLEVKTGVNRLYLFVGSVAFTGLYLVFGFGAELICNSIGFVYPAYMSMKALESPQKDDDTKWLTYWVVYACFSVIEYFSDFIVGWFPLYWLIKCIFIVWCYLPNELNGSLIIYNRIIRPYYQKHHNQIDAAASAGIRLGDSSDECRTCPEEKPNKKAEKKEPEVKQVNKLTIRPTKPTKQTLPPLRDTLETDVQQLVQETKDKLDRLMRDLH